MRQLHLAILACTICAAGFLFSGCAPYHDVTVGKLESAPAIGSPMNGNDDWKNWDPETLGTESKKTNSVGRYFKSRWLDFFDMFEVGVSGGSGAKFEVQYIIGAWGYGMTEVQRWRIGQRSMVLNEETTNISTLPFPASLILYPATTKMETTKSQIISLGGFSYENEHGIWPDPILNNYPRDRERIRMAFAERPLKSQKLKVTPESTAIGVDFHLLVGARAKIVPAQIFDFIVGLIGIDPVGDDMPVTFEKKVPATDQW